MKVTKIIDKLPLFPYFCTRNCMHSLVMKRGIVLSFLVLLPMIWSFRPAPTEERFGSEALIGTWLNDEKTVKVKIERLGSKYFGKIVWLEKPNWPDGTLKTDKFNPDPNLRSIPFIGLRIVKDLVYMGDDEWGKGSLYDPEHGKTYGCKITLTDGDTAEIRGYLGFSFIGKSVTFLRVDA